MNPLHINLLEIKAVINAFHFWQDQLFFKPVLLMSGNFVVVNCLLHTWGHQAPVLCNLIWQFLHWGDNLHLMYKSVTFPADSMSWLTPYPVIRTEWLLYHSDFIPVCTLWGRPMINLLQQGGSASCPPSSVRFQTQKLGPWMLCQSTGRDCGHSPTHPWSWY